MDALSAARRYFDAWNRRDPEAISAAFAADGTYTDPISGTIPGAAAGQYAQGLFETFPNLSFEITTAAQTSETSVAAEWIMRGANLGPMQGAPPTGKSVELYGSDFIQVVDGKIRSVRGYFDSGVIPRQLGMQVVVQPESIGPVHFGYSTYMNVGNAAEAGAVSVTVLQSDSAETRDVVRELSRQILGEMAQMRGFISFLGAGAGAKMHTVTAWEDEEAPRALMREGAHRDAVKRFFEERGIRGGVTAVFTPGRIGIRWARCESCGKMVDSNKLEGYCDCSAQLPSLLYW
jgi:steroid delta-isomerase-like uncharacterized protein